MGDELGRLHTLHTLILRGNALESLEGVRALRFVTYLDISRNAIRDVAELRFLQCFPFAQHIDLHGNELADAIARGDPVDRLPMPRTLYYCLPRNHIQTLIYRDEGCNEINDDVLRLIREAQDTPLTRFKQNEYSAIDYHRILLTQWDLMDIDDQYQPYEDQLAAVDRNNQRMEATLRTVIADQRRFREQLPGLFGQLADVERANEALRRGVERFLDEGKARAEEVMNAGAGDRVQ